MIKQKNPISVGTRFKELFIDYLVIVIYLLALMVVSLTFYFSLFRGVPKFNELQAHHIATFGSVVPLILLFSYQDYHGGTIGKKKAGLVVVFERKLFWYSLLRNSIKFLPWQLGHMSTIHGIYTDYDLVAILLSIVSITMLFVMLAMGLYRDDKRHLGNMLSHTQIQKSLSKRGRR